MCWAGRYSSCVLVFSKRLWCVDPDLSAQFVKRLLGMAIPNALRQYILMHCCFFFLFFCVVIQANCSLSECLKLRIFFNRLNRRRKSNLSSDPFHQVPLRFLAPNFLTCSRLALGNLIQPPWPCSLMNNCKCNEALGGSDLGCDDSRVSHNCHSHLRGLPSLHSISKGSDWRSNCLSGPRRLSFPIISIQQVVPLSRSRPA